MMAASAETELTPFERLGGHATLRAITDRFYDLMEQDPAYAALRAMHAADLAPMRASLPSFLAGWCGGPRDWWQDNPAKCMVSLHSPFAIDRDTAGQWAEAMRRAIADVAPADVDVAQAMGDVLERMALGMARR
ncbi:group II truncated hemoglobin [Novosphingobium pokkalii]|uniref:Group II truncated hemoglobin n=1 Tax=Novosphingobium pokkalii TaxID=1770194 RepID=A0ABV7V3I2_9SPHN|nr:group II truncated hemoglobin [Novosphingobium pokkalii]